MAQQPQNVQPQFQISYSDLPELSETFADSTEKISFENGIWKFEFCVTRLGEKKPTGIIQGKKYPTCRLVMPANAGLELANKLKGILEMMAKQGLIKAMPPANIVQAPEGENPI